MSYRHRIMNAVHRALGNEDLEYGIHFNPRSPNEYHGVAGMFGHKDAESQAFDAATNVDGLSMEDLDEAIEEWLDAEDQKPTWKYLLGI